MKKFLLLIIFFLSSCSPNTVRNDFNFSNQMSFEEFKIKLENYAKNNPYPDIDD
tara:strand:+ start:1079 stop:1240 length:162 start_codon:yes stop_codon:yes gene_type:complete